MRFYISLVVVVVAVSLLVYSGINSSAKKVVTASELLAGSDARDNIRLAAQVTEDKIQYQTEPGFLLQFSVRDVAGSDVVPVSYHGIMPDTLQAGRDVIMEGDYDGKTFTAATLMTQCPSKYRPPQVPNT